MTTWTYYWPTLTERILADSKKLLIKKEQKDLGTQKDLPRDICKVWTGFSLICGGQRNKQEMQEERNDVLLSKEVI